MKFSCESYTKDNVTLKNETTDEVTTVDYNEVRRLLLNHAEVDDFQLNSNGDVIRADGTVLNIAVRDVKNKNKNLHSAKKEKNDEFYTRLEDIEAELSHYDTNYFKDKVIYCPTDVAVNTGSIQQSQFVKYFQMNAHRLQFRKLIATCLIYKAAGDNDTDLDSVQNCYILERNEVPKQQKMMYSHDSNNLVVEEKDDIGMKYIHQDGRTEFVPYHIVNQAVTDANGKYKIVKRYIDHYDENTGKPVLCDTDKGLTWQFGNKTLSIKWCRIHPDGTEEMLPDECYYDNDDGSGNDFLTDMSAFPKDEDNNPCYELVGNTLVGLYPAAMYDYKEIEYADYTEYFMHCPSDANYISGDYRSEYCQKLFQEADVVVTNPPFSLFRDFVATLEKNNLNYALIGSENAITYKEIFPLLRSNKMYLGYNHVKEFNLGTGGVQKFGNICWYTNFNIAKSKPKLILTQKYDPQKYPKYDNYDAIEVSKVKDIPEDYNGVMGVPITFLDKYNPDQFDLIGISGDLANSFRDSNNKLCSGRFYVNGKRMYDRLAIKKKPTT